jgi:LysM repeat protein
MNLWFIALVLPIFATLIYSRIIMSLNYLPDRVSFKVFTYLFISLVLVSCGIGKSTLTTKSTSSIQEEILTYSKKYLGKPYRYSGKGPNSFDCSGFTSYVFRNFGYKLNSSSSGQDRQFPTIAKKEDLVIGDLVFFEGRSRNGRVGHVGIVTEIYPNNNFKFIHSSTTSGVIISSSTEPYYSSRYLRGGRVLERDKIYEITEGTKKTINSEPSTPSPTLIIVQNKSAESSESFENSEVRTWVDNDSEIKNKNKHKEKNNSDDKESSVEIKTDIILREDTIMIPPPVKIHTVAMGETLYSISRLYGCSVEELISWNPQLGSVIKTGDKLEITSR